MARGNICIENLEAISYRKNPLRNGQISIAKICESSKRELSIENYHRNRHQKDLRKFSENF